MSKLAVLFAFFVANNVSRSNLHIAICSYLRDYQLTVTVGSQHIVFHAMCQCIFYVLCFRVKEILNDPVSLGWSEIVSLALLFNCLCRLRREGRCFWRHLSWSP